MNGNNDKYSLLQVKVEELEKRLAIYKKNISGLTITSIDSLSKELADIQTQVDEIIKNDNTETILSQLSSIQSSIEAQQTFLNTIESNVNNLSTQQNAVSTKLTTIEADVKTLTTQQETYAPQFTNLQEQITALQNNAGGGIEPTFLFINIGTQNIVPNVNFEYIVFKCDTKQRVSGMLTVDFKFKPASNAYNYFYFYVVINGEKFHKKHIREWDKMYNTSTIFFDFEAKEINTMYFYMDSESVSSITEVRFMDIMFYAKNLQIFHRDISRIVKPHNDTKFVISGYFGTAFYFNLVDKVYNIPPGWTNLQGDKYKHNPWHVIGYFYASGEPLSMFTANRAYCYIGGGDRFEAGYCLMSDYTTIHPICENIIRFYPVPCIDSDVHNYCGITKDYRPISINRQNATDENTRYITLNGSTLQGRWIDCFPILRVIPYTADFKDVGYLLQSLDDGDWYYANQKNATLITKLNIYGSQAIGYLENDGVTINIYYTKDTKAYKHILHLDGNGLISSTEYGGICEEYEHVVNLKNGTSVVKRYRKDWTWLAENITYVK